MTREEEIKKQAEKKALEPSRLIHPYAKQYKVMSAYEIGFIEGAVWADEHPHWISVEKRKPKFKHKNDGFQYSEAVIVTDGEYCTSAHWTHSTLAGWYAWFDRGAEELKGVTHWMPMPAPPHHIIDANKKKVDRVIGTADHIKTALDVMKEGGEK